jgi:hypothetical protein
MKNSLDESVWNAAQKGVWARRGRLLWDCGQQTPAATMIDHIATPYLCQPYLKITFIIAVCEFNPPLS